MLLRSEPSLPTSESSGYQSRKCYFLGLRLGLGLGLGKECTSQITQFSVLPLQGYNYVCVCTWSATQRILSYGEGRTDPVSGIHAAAHLKTLTKTQKCYLYLQHNIMQHCPERGICLCFSLSYCKPCVTIPGKEATFSHFPHSACDCPGLAQHPPLAV